MKTAASVALLLCITMLLIPMPITLADLGHHARSKISCDKRSLSGGIAGASAGVDLWECWGGQEVSHLHDITEDIPKVRKALQWCLDEPGELRLKAPMMVKTTEVPIILLVALGIRPYAVVTVDLDAAECS